jgi:hypothetical protein
MIDTNQIDGFGTIPIIEPFESFRDRSERLLNASDLAFAGTSIVGQHVPCGAALQC